MPARPRRRLVGGGAERLVRLAAATVALAAALAAVAAGRGPERSKLPNIVVFYADDQGFGDHDAVNPGHVSTPTMARLVREGINFTDAHSAAAVCTPSRYGILTGNTPSRVRPGGGVANVTTKPIIPADVPTIAGILRSTANYATGMVGKWHLGLDIPGPMGHRAWDKRIGGGPADNGFDTFYGVMASLNYGFLTYLDNDRVKAPADLWTSSRQVKGRVINAVPSQVTYTFLEPSEVRGNRDKEIAAGFSEHFVMANITARALDFIEVNKHRPFFLYFAASTPHQPIAAHPDFRNRTRFGEWTDVIEELDHRAGQILRKLDEVGVGNQTIFIWTSDNGPENYQSLTDNLFKAGYFSNGIGFRGSKRSIYEGGHRVPTFMRWPDGLAEPGRKVDRPVSQLDIMATVLDLAGISSDAIKKTDSISFADVVVDASPARSNSTSRLYPIIYEDQKARMAVRVGRTKLIPFKQEAYDMDADISEKVNIWDSLDHRIKSFAHRVVFDIQKRKGVYLRTAGKDPFVGGGEQLASS